MLFMLWVLFWDKQKKQDFWYFFLVVLILTNKILDFTYILSPDECLCWKAEIDSSSSRPKLRLRTLSAPAAAAPGTTNAAFDTEKRHLILFCNWILHLHSILLLNKRLNLNDVLYNFKAYQNVKVAHFQQKLLLTHRHSFYIRFPLTSN